MNLTTIEGVGTIRTVSMREIHRWPTWIQHECDFVMADHQSIPPTFVIGVHMHTFEAIFLLPSLALKSMAINVTNVKSRALQSFALFTNAEDAAMFKLML